MKVLEPTIIIGLKVKHIDDLILYNYYNLILKGLTKEEWERDRIEIMYESDIKQPYVFFKKDNDMYEDDDHFRDSFEEDAIFGYELGGGSWGELYPDVVSKIAKQFKNNFGIEPILYLRTI